MLRNILMSAPALAFVLPFVAAQPSMARPLASPVEASLWGDKFDDDDDDDDDGGDQTLELTVCFETQIEIDTGDDRAYECGIQKGPSCVSRCTAEAVAPLCDTGLALAARSNSCVEDAIATCERQCESGGAAFCAPSGMKARWGDDDDDDLEQLLEELDDHDDDDDDDNGGDDVVFIDIETCIDLELNLEELGDR
jgi:hypothetical protein